MKMDIVKISKIQFKDFNGIKRLVDIKQTAAYEFMSQRNKDVHDIDIIAAYVKTKLLFNHNIIFETAYVDKDSDEYRHAANSINNYETFDCFADDADYEYLAHPYKNYILSWPTTMYMYAGDWFKLGYGAFIGTNDWDDAFEQVIYEYLLEYMPVYVS